MNHDLVQREAAFRVLLFAKIQEAAAQKVLGNRDRGEAVRSEAHALLDGLIDNQGEQVADAIRNAGKKP